MIAPALRPFPALLSVLTLALPAAAAEGGLLTPLHEPLSPERSRVGVIGHAPVDPAEVRRLVLAIAAKETLRRQFDWFQPIGEPPPPVESKTSVDLPPEARSGPLRLHLAFTAKCADGWRSGPALDALCPGGPPAGAVVQATTQIMMGHGEVPRTGLALGARAALRGD
jgi:hypothetical protein